MASRKVFGPDSVSTRENITVRLVSKKLKAYGYPAEYFVRHVPTALAEDIVNAIGAVDEIDAPIIEKEQAVKRVLCDHVLCDRDGAMAFADNYELVYSLPMSVINEMLQGWITEFAVMGTPGKMVEDLSAEVQDSLGELAKKNLASATSSTSGE